MMMMMMVSTGLEKVKWECNIFGHSLGYYELKQHKSWFEDKNSKQLVQKKQAKLQRLLNPSQQMRIIWTL